MSNYISTELIRRAFVDWHKPDQLAAHAICNADAIAARIQALPEQHPQAIAGVVREVLLDALHVLQTEQTIKVGSYREAVRDKSLLVWRYIEGNSIAGICEALSISQPTYYRYTVLELNTLAEILQVQLQSLSMSPAAQTKDRTPLHLNVPDLPQAYLPRHTYIDQLVENLTASTNAGFCALVGLPGVGKSTLATAIVHHPTIQQHFPDGVIWMDVGQHGSAERCLKEMLEALKPDGLHTPVHSTAEELTHSLRSLLATKRLLLVIDDVWDLAIAQALSVGSPASVHLVTTRSPALAYSIAGANVIKINEFSVDETKALLTQFIQSGSRITETSEAIGFSDETIERMNRLPLAIVLTGRHLRYLKLTQQHQRMEDTLHSLGELVLPQNVDTLNNRIEHSLKELGVEATTAAACLAIFPPKPNTFREYDAMGVADCTPALLDQLVDVGLLEAWRGRLAMHKAIHDHLIHNHGQHIQQAQKRIVGHYTKSFEKGPAPGLEDCANVAVAMQTAISQAGAEAQAELLHDAAWLFEEAGLTKALSGWIEEAQRKGVHGQQALELSAEAARLSWLNGHSSEAIQQLEACIIEAQQDGFKEVVAECWHTLAYIQVEQEQDEAGFADVDNVWEIASTASQQRLAKSEIAAVRQLVMRSRLDSLRSMMARVVVKLAGKHADRADVVLASAVVAWLDYLNGEVDNAEARLRAALASPYTRTHPLIAAITNGALARLCCFEGRYIEADAFAHKCIEPATREASPEFTALAYDVLGLTHVATGNVRDAHRWFDEGLAFTNSHHNPLLKAALLTSKSELFLRQGFLQQAESTAVMANQIAALATDPIMRCAAATVLAACSSAQVRIDEADALFAHARDAGALDTSKANSWSALQYQLHYAHHALRKQNWDAAEDALQATLALARQLHAPAYEGRAWYERAQIALMKGNADDASHLGRRGLELLTQIRHVDATEIGKWLFENKLTGHEE